MKKLLALMAALVIFSSCSNMEKINEYPKGQSVSDFVPEVYLTIEGWDSILETTMGNYEWEIDNGNGTKISEITCGSHMLANENIEKLLTSGKKMVYIIFEEEPVSYELFRYEVEEDRWLNGGYTGNEKEENVDVSEDSFVILGDGKTYVYVIKADYKNGKCEYGFQIMNSKITVKRLKIADGAESGKLVLCGSEGNELYTVDANNIPVYLDGERADASVLMDGMTAEIHYGGITLESYPAMFGEIESIHVYSIGTKNEPGGGYFDICGLYFKVLDDIWERDGALNEGISMVSIDISSAPGNLSEGEIAAITYVFGNKHKIMTMDLGMEELKEQGFLTAAGGMDNLYQWDNGILITITNNAEEGEFYSLPTVKFDAMKWRSPLRAYMFMDCSAVWPQMGTWTDYNIGAEAIS